MFRTHNWLANAIDRKSKEWIEFIVTGKTKREAIRNAEKHDVYPATIYVKKLDSKR
jgi:hypothetical protein